MGVKSKIEDKAIDLRSTSAAQAKAQYIQKVMKWEDVDYEVAFYIVNGKTDPKEPEYTLGYKMADPIMMMAMFGQISKKKREMARDQFRKTLDDDELQLFNDYVNKNDVDKEWKTEYKSAKKNKKAE